MARFPISEPEIARLAHDLAAGLATRAEDFPSPPAPPERLEKALAAYQAAREAAIRAAAQAVQRTLAKDQALEELVDLMKSDLRYAENQMRADPVKLQYLGWGGRRPRTAAGAPGQARALKMVQEMAGGVVLSWTEPLDGGPVAAYKVQRRRRDGGGWVDVGTSTVPEIALDHQDPGVEYEYHVIAVNKVGEGRPSNMVRAVL